VLERLITSFQNILKIPELRGRVLFTVAKTLGRGNPFNVVRATLEGLTRLKDPEEVRKIRQMAVGEVSS